jgi:hypothetical protein
MAFDAPSELRGAAIPPAEAFLREVVEPGRPVVLRGATTAWPAVQAGRTSAEGLRAYLARFERNIPVHAFFGAPQIAGKYYYGDQADGFNFERRRLGFAQALDAVLTAAAAPETGSVYVGSMPTETCLPGLAAENRLGVLDPRVEPRIWIGNRSNVSCHYDALDNVVCPIAGRRRVTLYAPELIGDLYVGPIDHTMAGQPVSLAASAGAGSNDFPRFEAVRDRAMVVELEPGDALFMPKLWWHQIEALGDFSAMINFWWDATSSGPDAPYAALLLAMITLSERPLAERRAWRAFFDHYVFREGGHPLAHLPAEKHGILGPLKQNYGRVRAHVMQMLRGG